MKQDIESLEINLFDIIKLLWEKKLQIITIVSIFSVATIFYSLSIPNEYRSQAKLSFTQDTSEGLSSGSLGGLASMAGLNLSGENKASEATIAIEIMTSWSFIEDFITTNNLAVDLFAASGWDEEKNKVLIDLEKFDSENKKWVQEKPSSFLMYEKFLRRLSISPDYKNGMVSVSYDHFSPYFATELLDKYIDSINQHMRDRKLLKTDKNLEYLNAQLNETSNLEMRNIFFALIQEQVKERMLALATPDYALNFVYRPMVPELKFKPERSVMVILGAFLGFLTSAIFIISRHLVKITKS